MNFKIRHIWLFLFACIALGAPAMAGVDQDTLNKELMYRIKFGRFEDVKLLLDNGADANFVSPQGDPALSLAAGRNDPDGVNMLDYLLKKGANPNATDRSGALPILIAASNGEREMIEKLISKGSEYNFNTADGTSLVDIARASVNPDAAYPIQEAMNQEEAYRQAAYSPQRYGSILRRYAATSCEFQYWTYYLTSKQNSQNDAKTQKTIAATKAQLIDLVREIQTYYPTVEIMYVQGINEIATQQITQVLDDLISNRFRAEKGVGSSADADKRCQAIANHLSINTDIPKPRAPSRMNAH